MQLYGTSFKVPLKLKVWNLNYGNEIVLYEIFNTPISKQGPKQMITILLPKHIQLEENMFRKPCGFAYKVKPMCKYCKMPNAYGVYA